MCDYCALSPTQRKKLLATFHNSLKTGGHVLLDVYSTNAFHKREEATIFSENLLDGFWSPNRYYGFLNTFKYNQEKVILDKYTLIDSSRTWTIYNWIQYFSLEQLEKEFKPSGFNICQNYSDVSGTIYKPNTLEFAIVAEKP